MIAHSTKIQFSLLSGFAENQVYMSESSIFVCVLNLLSKETLVSVKQKEQLLPSQGPQSVGRDSSDCSF